MKNEIVETTEAVVAETSGSIAAGARGLAHELLCDAKWQNIAAICGGIAVLIVAATGQKASVNVDAQNKKFAAAINDSLNAA